MDKIIISDTSCLIALHNIGLLHILSDLYQKITLTKEVQNEFGENLPEWGLLFQKQKTKKNKLR